MKHYRPAKHWMQHVSVLVHMQITSEAASQPVLPLGISASPGGDRVQL